MGWTWSLKRAGVRLSGGSAVTRPSSGSCTVRRLVSNRAAADAIAATATHGGEKCTVSAST